jgi:CDP-glycerol glycerophosphotransferase (TagB/SpsB family)
MLSPIQFSRRIITLLAKNGAIGFVLKLLGDLIFLATCLVPKNTNLWLFGAWFGERYADNSKYLFEYVNRDHPDVRAVWLTKDAATRDLVSRHGYEAHLIGSLQGLFLRALSGVWIVTTTHMVDLNTYYTWPFGRVMIVQLWHGTPLKKIGYDLEKNRMHPAAALPRFQVLPFNAQTGKTDLYIAASEEVRTKIATAFKVARDQVRVTGYPRTDAFFKADGHEAPVMDALLSLKNDHLLGIYLPTHRLEGRESLVSLMSGLSAINAALAELRVVLLVKPHFHHTADEGMLGFNLTNVRFITDEDINQDPYPVLPDTDFLITDYSSVYFDYLLLDRPVIFAPLDVERYADLEPLYYDYNAVTPGPKGRNWQEILTFIEDIAKKRDAYAVERERVNRVFNEYRDGDSSKRVYEAIVKKIGKA